MYKNTSYTYHRVTYTQSCVITKVHDLLGQPSYMYVLKCFECVGACSGVCVLCVLSEYMCVCVCVYVCVCVF